MPMFRNTLFHLHRRVGTKNYWAVFEPNIFPYKYPNILKPSNSSYLPAYKDGTECSETSAYKIQTPGNYPEESIQHPDRFWGPSSILFIGYRGFFPQGVKLVKLTAHLNLMSRIRMCGAKPPFLQTTFTACRGIVLPCTVPD
jgi:hypothetical protein